MINVKESYDIVLIKKIIIIKRREESEMDGLVLLYISDTALIN